MIRLRPLPDVARCILAGLLFIAAGCDTSPSELLTPVAETESSFENGLDGWVVRSGPSGGGSAAIVGGAAAGGSSYLEVTLQNPGDLIWIERSFTLDPGTSYNVTLSAEARSFSGSGELVYAAAGRVLRPDDLVSQGAVPGSWSRELMPTPVAAGPDGTVAVGVGVGASVSGAGTFGLDEVGVVFTVRPEG
jgi:hypothetical protein